MPEAPPKPSARPPSARPPEKIIQELIHRPLEQRLLEHNYRCAQSIVFGLPVIGLQIFGATLGVPEAARWVAIFQATLSVWVTYIAATGMISEGVVVLLRQRRVTNDLFVGFIALILELTCVLSVSHLLIN